MIYLTLLTNLNVKTETLYNDSNVDNAYVYRIANLEGTYLISVPQNNFKKNSIKLKHTNYESKYTF